MVATRSRSGASAAKTRSGSATSSKATSSAGKTTPSEKAIRPGTKQSVPREEEQPKVGRSWKWEHSAAIKEYDRQKKLPKKDWSKENDIAVLRARVIELEAVVLEKNKTIKYMERDRQRHSISGYRSCEEWFGLDEDDCPPPSDEWSD